MIAAAASDLVLNALYAARFGPGVALHDPTLRLLSLTVTNGLFVATYLLLSWSLWRAGALSTRLTMLGLPAWLAAAGLCVNGCGALPDMETGFAAVFVVFFCAWLVCLSRSPAIRGPTAGRAGASCPMPRSSSGAFARTHPPSCWQAARALGPRGRMRETTRASSARTET